MLMMMGLTKARFFLGRGVSSGDEGVSHSPHKIASIFMLYAGHGITAQHHRTASPHNITIVDHLFTIRACFFKKF